MQVYLETERLILRRFTHDDVDNLFDLDNDPAVMRFLTGGPGTSRDEIEHDYIPSYLAYYEPDKGYGFWAAIEKSTGDFLGWFHFRPNPGDPIDQPELGYRFRQSAWGKGYATEGSRALIDKGFKELGVQRVIASTYQDNLGSRRVMEKSGLRFVRSFRFSAEELQEVLGVANPELFDGEEVEYAVTRVEWEAQNTSKNQMISRVNHRSG